LILGESRSCTGIEILTAFIAGFEISCRIANSVESSHSQRGWHTTSTCGIFGAAAACGKLLGSDRQQILGAFGIAAGFSSGLRRNLGTPTKPIHAGQAAQNGMRAARLASLGIYGAGNIFSERRSFGDVFSSHHNEEELVSRLGEDYEILDNGFKLYPCCASAHAAIDGVLQLREENALIPEDVDFIRVGTVPFGVDNLFCSRPKDTNECRFSMPFCVALAVLDGQVTMENFSGERLSDERLQQVMQKVTMYKDPEMSHLGYRGTGNANITISTKKGGVYNKRVDAAKGRPSNPVSDEELWKKFRTCAKRAVSEERAERMLSLLTSLEELSDIEELLALTQVEQS